MVVRFSTCCSLTLSGKNNNYDCPSVPSLCAIFGAFPLTAIAGPIGWVVWWYKLIYIAECVRKPPPPLMGSGFCSLVFLYCAQKPLPPEPSLGDLREGCVAFVLGYLDPLDICRLVKLN
ncbi:hypothetical protein U1Q18_040196 [Sarracenia purpurea var. burkii]